MKVISKSIYSVYDTDGKEIKLFIPGNEYEAQTYLFGYNVTDENGETSFFIAECFRKMFVKREE